MERLARLSRDSGVSDRVRWLGFVESVSDLFDRSDVLVMPSEYEGFGMVAAEAMAAGLPVIVPRLSGVAELVADFEAGLLIERPSESCLLEALTEFDRCRDEWPRLGRNGTRAVNELLTFAGLLRRDRQPLRIACR